MTEIEAAFFYGDFSVLRETIAKLLSENGKAMWVQLKLFD